MMRLRMFFGAERSRAEINDGGMVVNLAAPVLGGDSCISVCTPAGEALTGHDVDVAHDAGDLIFGFLRGEAEQAIEASTEALYDRMFERLGERFLYRVWHFVPSINSWETGLENYRLFCRGRANAFGRLLGEGETGRISAASAVGSAEKEPVILFVGGSAEPRHAENPEQVPAYRYPPIYGPRAPSFSRASRVAVPTGEMVFISGTSSIKGSDTVHPDDCQKQVEVTLHNLSLIGETVGLGPDLGRSKGMARHFVVYLRRSEDFRPVEEQLRKELLVAADERVFLLADICRAELLVEIEATLFIPAGVPLA